MTLLNKMEEYVFQLENMIIKLQGDVAKLTEQLNSCCPLLMVEGVKYFMNEDDDRVHECELETLI